VPTHCVSIVIAAHYPVVLCGLTTILRAECDFSVVASCPDVASCIAAIRDLSPNLALLDASLPGQSGLEILAAIRSEHLCTRAVFLSESCDVSDEVQPIAGHAYGIIPRDAAPDILLRLLRRVSSGPELLPNPELLDGHGPKHSLATPTIALTERERQIMHLVCKGPSNKEIGRQLNLSEGTVKVHLHHIYQKLAIRNRTALAILAAPSIKEPS
jgi:two-component system, NarL family, nitrate/nitrite response regulator NarL